MYNISCVLNSSLNYCDTTDNVLKILHEECQLKCGMLTILDQSRDILLVKSVHSPASAVNINQKPVHYKVGEGIVGEVFRQGSSMVIRNLGQDMRFADKLALYDYDKPFVCVPLKDANNKVIGALSAQPPNLDDQAITMLTRFLDMTVNLIARNVQLAHQIETQQQQLVDERDGLRRKVRNNYSFKNLVSTPNPCGRFSNKSGWYHAGIPPYLSGENPVQERAGTNAIHYNSPRAANPFIKLNCAALPDNLLESELFE